MLALALLHMRTVRLILIFLLPLALLAISACTAFNPEVIWRIEKIKEQIAKDTILVSPRVHELRPGVELGFVAYMNVDKAQEMGAPNGNRFIELLDDRVTRQEHLLGHKICQYGYKAGSREPSINKGGDWSGVWTMGFDCNRKNGASQS
jgi:hypothetical protein